MDAIVFLDKVAPKARWDDRDKLAVACDYIDRQSAFPAFKDHVEQAVATAVEVKGPATMQRIEITNEERQFLLFSMGVVLGNESRHEPETGRNWVRDMHWAIMEKLIALSDETEKIASH